MERWKAAHAKQRETDVRTGKHPIKRAGWLSYFTVSWLNPLIHLGANRAIELEDLPNVPENVRADAVGERLEREWRAQADNPRRHLLLVLLREEGQHLPDDGRETLHDLRLERRKEYDNEGCERTMVSL